MTHQDRLDRLTVTVGEAPQQQHLHLAQQLGDDLVGAGIVNAANAREIHPGHGGSGASDCPFDFLANRAPRRSGHQIGEKAGHGLLQDGVHVDMLNHFRDPCSGMISSTCEPGNAGSPSLSGTSSSQEGTMLIRAVPLRMEIFPSHRLM